MSHFPAVKLIDEAGAAYGVKHIAISPDGSTYASCALRGWLETNGS